jgi:hypothetical protein
MSLCCLGAPARTNRTATPPRRARQVRPAPSGATLRSRLCGRGSPAAPRQFTLAIPPREIAP